MPDTQFDVIGLGNAIVDVLAHADDIFLKEQGLSKGAMTLIDADTAENLYEKMNPAVECSGGSAANTIAGVASLGGKGAFIGKVKKDQLGDIFRHDIRSLGIDFESAPLFEGPSTARCLVFVTPDAQRTLQTYLGASVEFHPTDIDPKKIKASKVTYLEGYLWDPPAAKEAFLKAASIAHDNDGLVSLSLSDPFCVDRHRADFQDLVKGHVDILFANEEEIISLYEVTTFDEALQIVREQCHVAALTRSEKGSVIVANSEVHVLDAEPVAKVVDTTGAGDAFAAGFLYGYTHDMGLEMAGRIGGIAAAEIISHFGARPETPLKELIVEKLG